jgi:hypothetical protein
MSANNVNQSQMNQTRFYESLSKRSVDPMSNPFFETVFNNRQSNADLLQYAGKGGMTGGP